MSSTCVRAFILTHIHNINFIHISDAVKKITVAVLQSTMYIIARTCVVCIHIVSPQYFSIHQFHKHFNYCVAWILDDQHYMQL